MNILSNSKRGWLAQEDKLLLQLVASAHSEKLKWVQVARVLQEKLGRVRTGKQCRQRWQHQLNPAIVRDEWTDMEQLHLFQLQAEFGNKWAHIAEKLPGRTDNAVKNFFYSAVRRVFTKVNMYLGKQRNQKEFKSIREFQTDFLSKLMAVVDGNYSKKIRLTNDDAILLAKRILQNVAVLSINHEEMEDSEEANGKMTEMVRIMHDFRKSCKKRKQRKNELGKEDMVDSEEEPVSSKSITESSQSYCSDQQPSRHGAECMQDQKQQIGYKLFKEIKNISVKLIEGEEITTSGSIELDQCRELPCKQDLRLFKIVSGLDDRRGDKWWEVLEVNQVGNPFKMEEESFGDWEWRQEDVFPMVSQREDLLSSSQIFGSNQVVTKFKMLEASVALEDLLLNTKRSSRFEQYQLFSEFGLGI